MVWGLPVVITDQVGIHSEVNACKAGLIAGCDVRSLASALVELAANPCARTDMGCRGALLARTEYSLEAVCARLLKLYTEVLSSSRHAAWDDSVIREEQNVVTKSSPSWRS
jgi:glycosyltransferase involved in cell wall biosynthesis